MMNGLSNRTKGAYPKAGSYEDAFWRTMATVTTVYANEQVGIKIR